MKSFASLALSLLAALPYAAAHGFVSQVTIDGKAYKGNVPNNPKFDSPIRLIDDVSPVKGASNLNLNCGQNATEATLVASANPGSTLAFSWNGGDGSHWPHNIGPLMTYMAECTGTTCDKFDSKNASWFKIHEAGQKSDGKTWVQQDLFDGKSVSVPLPNSIKAGDYLVRHEIIALHLATSEGGAEFYPSCTQIRIGGNDQGTPDASQEVAFPGGYKDTDPGIFDPDVFNPGANYTFPGPPLSNLVSNSTSSSNSSAPASGTSNSTSPSAVPSASVTPSSKSSSGNCRMNKKKRSTLVAAAITPQTNSLAANNAKRDEMPAGMRKKHYSRVMARIMPHAGTI